MLFPALHQERAAHNIYCWNCMCRSALVSLEPSRAQWAQRTSLPRMERAVYNECKYGRVHDDSRVWMPFLPGGRGFLLAFCFSRLLEIAKIDCKSFASNSLTKCEKRLLTSRSRRPSTDKPRRWNRIGGSLTLGMQIVQHVLSASPSAGPSDGSRFSLRKIPLTGLCGFRFISNLNDGSERIFLVSWNWNRINLWVSVCGRYQLMGILLIVPRNPKELVALW